MEIHFQPNGIYTLYSDPDDPEEEVRDIGILERMEIGESPQEGDIPVRDILTHEVVGRIKKKP